MGNEQRNPVRRLVSRVVAMLPNGGIGDEGQAPDLDGKRDTDTAYREAVLRTKSQMSPGGQGTTSYEPVERPPLD